MKKIFGILAVSLILAACKKDRTSGVCYCEFFSGNESEYDLTHLPKQQQIDTCHKHNTNAGNYGGECELE